MEALLKPASSTFPIRKYQLHERGYLTRDSLCFTSRPRMPVTYLQEINTKWNVKQRFELSALADNGGYVEKLIPHENYKLENELSSKHEDGYGSLIWKKLKAFYGFCRPYNLIGIEVGIFSISVLPIGSIADLSPKIFMALLQVLAMGALNHIYVMALNQLSDVEIDKVNKQYLPLASGELSTRDIVTFTLLATMLNIGIAFMSKSPALLWALAANYIYGTGYSTDLPFLRWKKHPLLAIPSTVLYCALGVQIPYFIHIQKYVLGRPNLITKSIIFQTMMICLYTFSGMIFKDIPDTDGDREFGLDTLSIRFGEERMGMILGVSSFFTILIIQRNGFEFLQAFSIGLNVLYAGLGFGVVVGASSSLWFGKLIAVLGHLALALAFWRRSRHTDPTNKSSAQSFHMFFWKVSAIEYFLTQFVR